MTKFNVFTAKVQCLWWPFVGFNSLSDIQQPCYWNANNSVALWAGHGIVKCIKTKSRLYYAHKVTTPNTGTFGWLKSYREYNPQLKEQPERKICGFQCLRNHLRQVFRDMQVIVRCISPLFLIQRIVYQTVFVHTKRSNDRSTFYTFYIDTGSTFSSVMK